MLAEEHRLQSDDKRGWVAKVAAESHQSLSFAKPGPL
jgi:hypothetical protein